METTETTEMNQPVSGPGNLLTEARLKLGLDPKNVAEMLHLREHQIRSLEADDYENLPEPTYVKGYLRAYCQMLSLEPEKIIKMYTDFITPPVKESFEGIAPDKQAASNDDLVKMVTIGMVIVVVGLAIAFWMGENDSEPVPEPAPVAVTPTPTIEQETDTAPANTTPVTNEVANTQPAAEQPAAEQPVPIKVEDAQPQETKPQSSPVTKPEPAPEPAASVSSDPQAVSLVPVIDETNRTRLLIKVAESSWVDVRDARGNKLIYETVPAGREIPLEGLAPFSVFLGNADQVQVQVEGKEFDFSEFKRGLTARFKVERKQGAQ